MSNRSLCIGALVAVSVLPATTSAAQCLVPDAELISANAGRDAIPSLTNPSTVAADAVGPQLRDTDRVLGVVQNGQARAYPLRILWWHEIINDVLGGVPIAVSYCPLTGSGLVYDPVLDGQHVTFGTSGLLFDNNLVMYDRTSASLWSQMMVRGVCGSYISHEPALYAVTEMTWGGWKELHPQTTVVSFATGYPRNYNIYPYGNYREVDDTQILFPLSFADRRLAPKALVHGIEHNGVARAYSLYDIGNQAERQAINDQINDRAVLVVYDSVNEMAMSFDRKLRFLNKKGKWKTKKFAFGVTDDGDGGIALRDRQTGTIWNLQGEPVAGELVGKIDGGSLKRIPEAYTAFWFAWAAFHRGTEIHGR